MSIVCACGKEYKTKRGYDNHVKTCKRVVNTTGATGATATSASSSSAPPSTSNLPENATHAGLTATSAGLTTLFSRFENLLRGAGIVGAKACEDIISLMIIRLLEPKFTGGEIDIMDVDKYGYDALEITAENIKYVKISELAKLSHEELYGVLKSIWNYVFAIHPATCQLFNKDRFLVLNNSIILAVMVKDLAKFDFEGLPPDCLAEVYQHFIHTQFKGDKGSKLGQHFTPGEVVRHMIDVAAEYIPPGATVCDPFCGTGGFLLAAYDKMRVDGRNPADYIYGTEIDIDVLRYAIANMLITSGKVCTGLKHKSAFDKNPRKYGAIFTNPPFGLKVQKNTIKSSWFAQTPTNTGNLLCLQLCMTLLGEGGICSMVFPAGSELSTQKGAAAEIRKRLCDVYELISITNLPERTFDYTPIPTVIITFRVCKCTLDPVKFYNYVNGTRELVREVDVITLEEKGFSFSAADYVVRAAPVVSFGFKLRKLDDICTFEKNDKKLLAGDGKAEGTYKFYTSSYKPKYCDEYQYEGPNILIGSGGNVNVHFANKFATSGDMHVLGISPAAAPIVVLKYIYLYFKYNTPVLENLQNGVTIKHITKAALLNVEIPVPSFARQTEIVVIIDRMEETRKHITAAVDGVKFEIEIVRGRSFSFDYPSVCLSDLVTYAKSTKKLQAADGKDAGKYKFYTSSQDVKYLDEYEFEGPSILMGRNGNFSVHLATQFTTTCDHVYIMNANNINVTYLYYFLQSNSNLFDNLYIGVAIKGLSKERIAGIMVPVPPPEIQEKYIAWAQNNENTRTSLKNKIATLEAASEDTAEQIRALFS